MQPVHRHLGLGRRALSLVEVMVAVGICAVTVVGVVGLFGPAVRDTREVAERRVVHRLTVGVDEALRRGGFGAAEAATASGATLQLVARADGMHLVALADAANDPVSGIPPGIASAERYFLIEGTRARRPVSETACLVVEVRVSWPYGFPPDGAIVPAAQRSEYRFHSAINP